jgi:hypothetical protein
MLGDIDDMKVLGIPVLKPRLAEVEEAAVWASGDGDALAKSDYPVTGVTAQIADILTADERSPSRGPRLQCVRAAEGIRRG